MRPGLVANTTYEIDYAGDWAVVETPTGFRMTTVGFPDLPGFKIAGSGDCLEVESDRAGIGTAFWTDRPLAGNQGVVASTRLSEVDVSNREIDGSAIEEISLLGHVLGNRTAVEGILRTTASAGLGWSAGRGVSTVPSTTVNLMDVPPNHDLADLIHGIGSLGDTGEAIELTGGLDSRLLLAIRILAGRKPRMAITFGSPDQPDVYLASALSEAVGIPHRVIPFDGNHPDMARRSIFNACQSGGITDLKVYASFIDAFDSLASIREEQITGAGGELAVDFYSVPGLESLASRGWWTPLVKRRIIQVPSLPMRASGATTGKVVARVAEAVCSILDSYDDEDNLMRLRRFYLEERLGNWAGPVLNASRYEYTPIIPMLHPSYAAWSNSLGRSDRRGRRAQETLLHQLVEKHGADKAIVDIPFAGPSRGMRKMAHWAGKVLRKIKGIDSRSSRPTSLVLDAWKADDEVSRVLAGLSGAQIFGQHLSPDELMVMSGANSSIAGPILGALAATASDRLSPRSGFPGFPNGSEWDR